MYPADMRIVLNNDEKFVMTGRTQGIGKKKMVAKRRPDTFFGMLHSQNFIR